MSQNKSNMHVLLPCPSNVGKADDFRISCCFFRGLRYY